MNKSLALSKLNIRDRIHTLREQQVMLDKDLAELYSVPTKVLNQAVARNIERFPSRFMFRLSKKEYDDLRSQIVTSIWGGRRTLPYAFTEQGVAMLSSILKSDTAIRISIQVIDAFVAMRRFIADNADIFYRLSLVEQKQLEHDKKFDAIFDAIQSRDIIPEKGIFFDGQIFDSYKFVSDIIRTADASIILIDNYVDDSVLTLFGKKRKDVKVTIFTREVTKQLALDLEKHNLQYPKIEIKIFKQSHDRFIIIDNKEIYHIGASLKDLGKKWFAFTRFDKETIDVLKKLPSC